MGGSFLIMDGILKRNQPKGFNNLRNFCLFCGFVSESGFPNKAANAGLLAEMLTYILSQRTLSVGEFIARAMLKHAVNIEPVGHNGVPVIYPGTDGGVKGLAGGAHRRIIILRSGKGEKEIALMQDGVLTPHSCRQFISVIRTMYSEPNPHLFQVVDVGNTHGTLLGARPSRQPHRGENRDDGNGHEQFNQRECN